MPGKKSRKRQESLRALRKQRRRLEADAYAEEARFWLNLKSADRLGYSRPVNKQAVRKFRKKP